MRLKWMRPVACAALLCCLIPAAGQAAGAKPKSREYYETRGEIVWEVPMEEKWIALTFDDGPDPVYTPQIAELLKQYEAKATFFVTGERTARFPDTARKLVADGHELGNHTMKHFYFRRGTSEKTIDTEIRKAKEAIRAAGLTDAPWFRPPGGHYNESIVAAAKQHGYTVVLWSWHQDTEDWRAPGVAKITNKVLTNARNGDIVLFHDHGEGASQTVQALKNILPELKTRGFRFVTVTELLGERKRHGLPVDDAG
jgi:polysaccharide deacetylase family sporulation protein PdaB